MTTTPAHVVIPATPATTRVSLRLGAVIVCHAIVDLFSFLFVPLITVIEGHLRMTHEQGAMVIALGSICSGLIQPTTAWICDRFNTRLPGVLGLLCAGFAALLVGHVQTFEQLLLLQVIAASGVGAFHPVAAAATGRLGGSRRSLALSGFYMAGMLGGMSGNVMFPVWVQSVGQGDSGVGLRSLAWAMIAAVVFTVVLQMAIGRLDHRNPRAHGETPPPRIPHRWRSVWLLYAGNAIRFTVNASMMLLVARWTEMEAMTRANVLDLSDALRGQASIRNGPLQASMQLGAGAAAMLAGAFIAHRHERLSLLICPVLGAISIAAFPFTLGLGSENAALIAAGIVCVIVGVGTGALVPMTIGMAQRLLPDHTSLASGLMLGGAWTLAAVGPPLTQAAVTRFGFLDACLIVAALTAASSGLALWLRVPDDAPPGAGAQPADPTPGTPLLSPRAE
ncbi:MAG: MFS transporter [Phycisphaeraceae bacterium]|nr:MFS transporter [Phycisphaeraceae bacterium]